MVVGQTKIIDSAIVVVGYNVIGDRSTGSEYLANENFYIWPYEYGKIKKIEKALILEIREVSGMENGRRN